MDEYENMFFAPASQIIVETENDLEMGVVISHNDLGLAFHKTHRLRTVTHFASDEQKEKVNELFKDMSTGDLKRYARENGLGLLQIVTWKAEKIRKACISYALNQLERDVQTLTPLSRPVRQMLTYGEISRITDAVEFIEENTLSPLDFSASVDYSEVKTKDPEANPS